MHKCNWSSMFTVKKKKYNDTILLASSSSSNPPDHHHSLPRCKPPLLLESIDTNSANRFFLALIIIIIVVVVDDIVDAIDTWAHFHITTIELKWQYWPRSLLATILNDWQLRGVYFVCVCLISVWLFFCGTSSQTHLDSYFKYTHTHTHTHQSTSHHLI